MAFIHLHNNKTLEAREVKVDGDGDINIDGNRAGTPVKYVSLDRVYSAASRCVSAVGSSNVMSKKVKARKLVVHDDPCPIKPPVLHVYSRRSKRRRDCNRSLSFFESLVARSVKIESIDFEESIEREVKKKKEKRTRIGCTELKKLEVDSTVLMDSDRRRLRDCRIHNVNINSSDNNKNNKRGNFSRKKVLPTTKRWVRLNFDGVDPATFVGFPCKVYWPLDAAWYSGRVAHYCSETKRHHVKYEDGDEEDLGLLDEKIKFFLSHEEVVNLNLKFNMTCTDADSYNYDEMVALAASLDDCQDLEPGDIIWAKLTGHAMWPAIIVDEALISDRKGLNRFSGGRSVLVQFFGTHDFARVKPKQIISFLKGLLSCFHHKCKKPQFAQSLEEAKVYLSEQKLPKRMLQLQNGKNADSSETLGSEDEGSADSGGDRYKDEGIQKILGGLSTSPYVIGDLQILSLGRIVKDSEYFQDDRFIWPEGYTALRKFKSIADPNICTVYKMEVLRDAESKIRPLFRVTLDNGEQIKGSTPSACWNKIYKRMKKLQNGSSNSINAENGVETIYESGSDMFGFSNPQVIKLIKGLLKSRLSSKLPMCNSTSDRYQNLPVGYRPVRVNWKDLDKCNVCHMDEEYENNLFLQCEKCRMMVHARCYGELEPVDGVLWLCNLCRPGAPESPPPCCLCPVTGGAMKPTTDGRWAHLACAIWIPETCLFDVKRMEPIDGLNRINKDRWKLLCSICGVAYGACIQNDVPSQGKYVFTSFTVRQSTQKQQNSPYCLGGIFNRSSTIAWCSNNNCRAAYHPLCARAAGLCVELEDEDRLHLLSLDDDEDHHCIRLLSFCKRHKQPSNERPVIDERISRIARCCSDYIPPSNPSGCARTEPYNHFGRRGRKEPEVLAAASLKRLFVENQPYLVGGFCKHDSSIGKLLPNGVVASRSSFNLQRFKASQLDSHGNILSMAEKYKYMRETFRKRLTFGKSGIHGFGIFAKQPFRAGDMVIEYIGELVRPPIADRRERFIYNSLVGAGTYMFRIDDERVIDATRAGSIAHLINHACEPNCYSRVISVNGDEHIIIFAKRDIRRWEELTYDYRFFSIDEQLACYCGFPRCRGVVNDTEAEEQVAKLYAPCSELIDWKGE